MSTNKRSRQFEDGRLPDSQFEALYNRVIRDLRTVLEATGTDESVEPCSIRLIAYIRYNNPSRSLCCLIATFRFRIRRRSHYRLFLVADSQDHWDMLGHIVLMQQAMDRAFSKRLWQ